MSKTHSFFILSILSFFVVNVSLFAGDKPQTNINQIFFEGAPSIHPPRVIANYTATPFMFYIPTTGQRPMEWSAEKLPKGLKLDSKTGIITGTVASEGEYIVTLKAKNSQGTCTQKLEIHIGDDLLLTPPMGWNSWNTSGNISRKNWYCRLRMHWWQTECVIWVIPILISMTSGSCRSEGLTDIYRLIKRSFLVE